MYLHSAQKTFATKKKGKGRAYPTHRPLVTSPAPPVILTFGISPMKCNIFHFGGAYGEMVATHPPTSDHRLTLSIPH